MEVKKIIFRVFLSKEFSKLKIKFSIITNHYINYVFKKLKWWIQYMANTNLKKKLLNKNEK